MINKEKIEEAARQHAGKRQNTWLNGNKFNEDENNFIAGANWALSQSEGKPKKKLKEITEEDLLFISQIANKYFPLTASIEHGIELMKAIKSDNILKLHISRISTLIAISQFFESKGYDLPKYYPSPELTQKVEENREQWIPVSERLPEETGEYAICITCNDETFTSTASFNTQSKEFRYGNNYITHWMQLPELPQTIKQ